MKKVLLAVFTLSIMLFAATAQANLISNGGFDEGLDGWNNSILTAMPSWNAEARPPSSNTARWWSALLLKASTSFSALSRAPSR